MKLAPAVERLISATNSDDSEAFLTAFAPDATLIDFGRQFRGHEQIARWDRQENIGTQNRLSVKHVEMGPPMLVRVAVSGKGYNGDGSFEIELTDGLISRLSIT